MAEGDLLTKEDIQKPRTPAQEDRENERLKAKAYEQEQLIRRLEKDLEEAKAEKRKPGITVVEEDGAQSRKKRPNSWGLSDIVLPPYTKRRVAIYRICPGDEGKNPATNLPVDPVDVSIPGRFTFYDKFAKDPLRNKIVISNITGTETKIEDGKPVIYDVVEDVLFPRGCRQVDVEKDYALYVLLELHPNYKFNKYRPSNAPVIFERMDIDVRSSASQAAALDLTLDAGRAVKDMNKEDVLSYAAGVPGLNTAAGRPIHEIKTDLQRWAMSNPIPFFKLNKNAKAGIQIVVLDAINFGLIGYRPDKKGYVDMETDEIISVHTASEEPMERLVKYLSTAEGKEWYTHIQSRLNYWSND